MAEPKKPAGLEAVQAILQGSGNAPKAKADPPAADPPATLTGATDKPKADPPATGAKEKPKADPPATVTSEKAPADPLAGIDTSDLGVEPPKPADGEKPTTLDQAAKNLGLTIEQLYDLEVPLRDGAEPVTLGTMKDRMQESEDLIGLRSELDDRRSSFENEMMRARQELQRVVELLPTVPPALIEQAQQAHIAHVERERVALLSIKPEWRDPAAFASAKDAMLEVCAPYGFTRLDLDLVIDHRLTKLLHDFASLKQRVDRASASFKAVQTQQNRGGQKQSASQKVATAQAATKAAAQDGTPAQKTAAVDAILRQQQ